MSPGKHFCGVSLHCVMLDAERWHRGLSCAAVPGRTKPCSKPPGLTPCVGPCLLPRCAERCVRFEPDVPYSANMTITAGFSLFLLAMSGLVVPPM